MVYHGDCLEIMRGMDADSVDAIVTDPPYGLKFMGKVWDHGVPGAPFWQETWRLAKPGAHLLAFGGTRTFHRLACAIEDAGWEIRDCVMWVYGTGFPKSLDVSKAIDKAAGAERERIRGVRSGVIGSCYATDAWSAEFKDSVLSPESITEAARQWQGWGTALKPAWEPIILARKPLAGTVAENVLKWGTGGLNVDGFRVGTTKEIPGSRSTVKSTIIYNGGWRPDTGNEDGHNPNIGRWPANLIHDGSKEVMSLFPVTTSGTLENRRTIGFWRGNALNQPVHFAGDFGSAARFFYCAKASKAERDAGLEGMPLVERQCTKLSGGGMPLRQDGTERKMPLSRNHHPTVKPVALLRYLCRLITPPGGLVLDPFCGSGSTGIAAGLEGFRFVGIEQDADYCRIAEARIQHALNSPELAQGRLL